VQQVQIRINLVRRLDTSHIEAIGCGRYQVAGRVTDIGVHIRIGAPGLDIEIKEFSPSGTGAPVFVTDGSHKGRLTDDLQTIETEWVTISNGQRGRLNLTAGGEVSCAGDQAGVVPPSLRPIVAATPGRIAGPAGDPFRFDFFMPYNAPRASRERHPPVVRRMKNPWADCGGIQGEQHVSWLHAGSGSRPFRLGSRRRRMPLSSCNGGTR